MKNFFLLLTGAGLGIAAYVFFGDQAGAWGAGERLSGTGNSVKGGIKEGFGELTDDHSTQASGIVDKVKGAAQQAVGSVAQKIDSVVNDVS